MTIQFMLFTYSYDSMFNIRMRDVSQSRISLGRPNTFNYREAMDSVDRMELTIIVKGTKI